MIRKATINDNSQLQKMFTQAYQTTYHELLPHTMIQEDIQNFYNQERIIKDIEPALPAWSGYLVAEEAGQIVGAIGGGLLNSEECEVFVLYLNPEKKRKGYGSALLAELTEIFLNFGAKKQWVSVTKDNQMGIPFYEKQGFIFQHERPAYTHEKSNRTSLRYLRMLTRKKAR